MYGGIERRLRALEARESATQYILQIVLQSILKQRVDPIAIARILATDIHRNLDRATVSNMSAVESMEMAALITEEADAIMKKVIEGLTKSSG